MCRGSALWLQNSTEVQKIIKSLIIVKPIDISNLKPLWDVCTFLPLQLLSRNYFHKKVYLKKLLQKTWFEKKKKSSLDVCQSILFFFFFFFFESFWNLRQTYQKVNCVVFWQTRFRKPDVKTTKDAKIKVQIWCFCFGLNLTFTLLHCTVNRWHLKISSWKLGFDISLCPTTKSGEGIILYPSQNLSVRLSISAYIIRVWSVTLIPSEVFSPNFSYFHQTSHKCKAL